MEETNGKGLVTEEALSRLVGVRDPDMPKPLRAIVFRLGPIGSNDIQLGAFVRCRQYSRWAGILKPVVGMKLAVGDMVVILPDTVYPMSFPGCREFSFDDAMRLHAAIVRAVETACNALPNKKEGASRQEPQPSAG